MNCCCTLSNISRLYTRCSNENVNNLYDEACGFYGANMRIKKFFDIGARSLRLGCEKTNDNGDCYNLACIHSLWGNKAKAIDALSKAFKYGYDDISYLKIDPDMDNIRNLDKFKDMIKKN